MTNSADPDQLASSEANRSRSTLLRQGMSLSAREGLILQNLNVSLKVQADCDLSK